MKSTSCQDCGNKSKRDCAHKRCRTCCKSKGFHCSTHVKSTWVPVVKRRQKQQQLKHLSNTVDHHHFHHLSLPLSLSNIHHHCPTSTPEGLEMGNLPAEVNSLATFRRIRVSSEDNMVDQYAYQTSTTIGGHVFKGVLYDQSFTTAANRGGESDNHHFNLMTTPTTTVEAIHPGGGANLVYHPPPSLYSAHGSFNGFMAGMQFFPHPRP